MERERQTDTVDRDRVLETETTGGRRLPARRQLIFPAGYSLSVDVIPNYCSKHGLDISREAPDQRDANTGLLV